MVLDKYIGIFGTLLFLSSCGGGNGPSPPIPPSPVTINPIEFLAQSINPDGNLNTPINSTDFLTYRRIDYGGYQVEDSAITGPSSAITTWAYSPFGVYNPLGGDGGEEYVIEGDTVRITATRHGVGQPILPTGYFVGKNCGGTGWVSFKNDATSDWKSLIASLNVSTDPNSCSNSSKSYTQYILLPINLPNIGTVDCIVSEHYDSAFIQTSQALERFFLCKGWGRLVWQAFASNRDPSPEIDIRCPDFGWNGNIGELKLVDCRVVTNIINETRQLTVAQEWYPGE